MVPREAALGPYALVRPLAERGTAEAFLATRAGADGFQKRVIVRRAPRRCDPAEVIAEANRCARLSHAGIVHVLDAGVFDGLCVVVTDYAPGITLARLLRTRGPLPWRAAARIASRAAEALAYAHALRRDDGTLLGIVHQRLTPEHIVVCAAGHVRLTGFGTRWAWARSAAFVSPEELRGEPIDGRADVFALGRILAQSVGPHAPPELERVIVAATRPLPERRSTTFELDRALRALVSSSEAATALQAPALR